MWEDTSTTFTYGAILTGSLFFNIIIIELFNSFRNSEIQNVSKVQLAKFF